MEKAVILEGKLIDPLTIRLLEPVSIKNNTVKVIISETDILIPKRTFGSEKEIISIKDDFYAPLDDFAEYM